LTDTTQTLPDESEPIPGSVVSFDLNVETEFGSKAEKEEEKVK